MNQTPKTFRPSFEELEGMICHPYLRSQAVRPAKTRERETKLRFRSTALEFLSTFASLLQERGFPAIHLRHQAAYWLDDGGKLGQIAVFPHIPRTGVDLVRVDVNRQTRRIPRHALRYLGAPENGVAFFRRPDGVRSLELTSILSELVDFAPWLTALVIAGTDNAAPLPPHPISSRFQDDQYFWSAAAWTRYLQSQEVAK